MTAFVFRVERCLTGAICVQLQVKGLKSGGCLTSHETVGMETAQKTHTGEQRCMAAERREVRCAPPRPRACVCGGEPVVAFGWSSGPDHGVRRRRQCRVCARCLQCLLCCALVRPTPAGIALSASSRRRRVALVGTGGGHSSKPKKKVLRPHTVHRVEAPNFSWCIGDDLFTFPTYGCVQMVDGV